MNLNVDPRPIIESAGSRLIPCGQDRYRCACPVHGGDGPSMSVRRCSDGKWRVYCFACGFDGDTVDLVMALRGFSFPEALRELDCATIKDAPPAGLHRRESITIACDAPGCGTTFDAVGREYKVPGKLGQIWSTTATEEAFFLAASRGWEMGAEGTGAICPGCIGRHDFARAYLAAIQTPASAARDATIDELVLLDRSREFNRVTGRTADLSTGNMP